MRRFYDTIPTVIFMTDITVIHVGNIKDSFFGEALSEYKKRMAAFCRFREIEIKEEKCDLPSEVDKCLAKEADKILAALPKKRVSRCALRRRKADVIGGFRFAEWQKCRRRRYICNRVELRTCRVGKGGLRYAPVVFKNDTAAQAYACGPL